MLQVLIIVILIAFIYYTFITFKLQKEYDEKMRKRLMENVEEFRAHETSNYDLKIFESTLLNEKITSIKIYQINDTFIHSKQLNKYIIDGGIEFMTSKGYFTIGFSNKYEQFIFNNSPFESIYENENYFELEKDEVDSIFSFLFSKIIDVKFKESQFDEIVDYTMKTEKRNKLVEVLFTFEDSRNLQISLVNNFYEDKRKPKPHKYSIDEEILISLNKIEIE